MAASSLDGHYLELARSMEIPSIPERLRCATCDKLAINAVKLSCCDNTICSDCHEKLTATECPICTHSPFSADMCVPAKALQTTVKVFIKNEAKKRGIDLKTGLKIVPATPAPAVAQLATTSAASAAAPVIDSIEVRNPSVAGNGALEASGSPAMETTFPVENQDAHTLNAQTDSVHTNGSTDEKVGDQDQDDEDDDDDDDVVITTERPELDAQQQQSERQDQNAIQGANEGEGSEQIMQMDSQQQGFGFDQNMGGFGNGNFGNMNMNAFNPMMGMPGFGMGMPNAMNMPGMGMDPSMMFNGGFGGMGDMSMMGMGMGGMGMSGMGDFGGMGGPGFFPNQGNYMQSNYGNAHRQNFFNDRGYGRGYGRGFGRGARGNQYGRGRGGHSFAQQQQQQQQQYSQNQQFGQQQAGGPQQSGANSTVAASGRRASPSYEAGQGTEGTPVTTSQDKSNTADLNGDLEMDQETNPAGVDDTNQAAESMHPSNNEDRDTTEARQEAANEDGKEHNAVSAMISGDGDMQMVDGGLAMDASGMQNGMYNDYEEGTQNQHQSGYGNNNWGGRGALKGGRNSYAFSRAQDSTELTPAPAPPVNAPTGPKAMRQGLPNTGWAGRALTQPKPTPTPVPDNKLSTLSAEPQSKEETEKREGDRGRSSSRSRSHSPSKRRSSRHRERDDNDYESEDSYNRRKERERRKRRDREERYDNGKAGKEEDKSSRKHRSRSESRTDDSSRRHHRDREEDYRSSRSHRTRSKDRHRRRHRSKSPAKEDTQEDYSRRKSRSHHERDADYEEGDRHKESRRSRKHSARDDDDHYKDDRKDRAHRSSKHDRRSKDDMRNRDADREHPRPVIEPPSDELGFKIKGSKSAKANKENVMAPPTGPSHDRSDNRRSSVQGSTPTTSVDPYAEERARAQQNREAREAQRRISSSTSLGKRGRGDEEEIDAPRGPKGDRGRVKKGRKERRVNYKYEDEVGEDQADERDADRWR